MADVVLSTVDLDVFGGPTSLDVSVDFGQTGQRGSRIWAGALGPTIDLVGQDVLLFDWYINTTTGKMFQYIVPTSTPEWVEVLSLVLPQYSVIASSTFTSGSTTIDIPIINLTQETLVSASDFVVRYSIVNSNPVSSGFTYSISGTDIEIVINAIEYSGGSWSNLSGSKNIHLFITYTG